MAETILQRDFPLLIRAGRKVECPFCERRAMSEAYRPFHQSGIGQHIRAAHPDRECEIISASREAEREMVRKEKDRLKEIHERPLRKHVLTGAEIDEIIAELGSLISMMEPYWSQGNAADSAHELIKRLELMASSKESDHA